MEEQLARSALDYHRYPTPGKISITPTKEMTNKRDLALAHSPGVAAACTTTTEDPQQARELTGRANLVAADTNGIAVLGLANIGTLAGKPVMEGKGCLFKKLAGIDVFNIEINEADPDQIIEIVARSNAGRRGAIEDGARHSPSGIPAQRRNEPSRHAERPRRQHYLQCPASGGGASVTVGPILLDAAKPIHLLTPTVTVRGIVDMTALTAVEAAAQRQQPQPSRPRKAAAE
jgi:Malic enzyme, N-terminal domain